MMVGVIGPRGKVHTELQIAEGAVDITGFFN